MVSRYQPFYFLNGVASVVGYGRGGYRYQTSHSTSRNHGGCGMLLVLSVAFSPVHESFNGDEIGEHRSQTSNLPSHNRGGGGGR